MPIYNNKTNLYAYNFDYEVSKIGNKINKI